MNFLPKEVEDIIINYKIQMEHKEKYSKCMNDIKKIKYIIHEPEPETIQREINEEIEHWEQSGVLTEPIIYPMPLYYFYKNSSVRITGAKRVSYNYYYEQLICLEFNKRIIVVEDTEVFVGDDITEDYRDFFF